MNKKFKSIQRVSIHASSREDATIGFVLKLLLSHCFNPRVLAGGRDHGFYSFALFCFGFNPRVLAGGRDDTPLYHFEFIRGFNPRVLAGGRDLSRAQVLPLQAFQSTRPRGRTRQVRWKNSADDNSFNPRVLAGGRDLAGMRKSRNSGVSIHASSREDATKYYIFKYLSKGFNPRVLAGGRDNHFIIKIFLIYVSIHASSREDATGYAVWIEERSWFQSTRPRGRTRPMQ